MRISSFLTTGLCDHGFSISKSNQVMLVPNCTEVVNLDKFPRGVCKISCSQTYSIWSHTDGQTGSPYTECLRRFITGEDRKTLTQLTSKVRMSSVCFYDHTHMVARTRRHVYGYHDHVNRSIGWWRHVRRQYGGQRQCGSVENSVMPHLGLSESSADLCRQKFGYVSCTVEYGYFERVGNFEWKKEKVKTERNYQFYCKIFEN